MFSVRGVVIETKKPKTSPDVTLQRIGNEAILHDRRNGRAHVINESAARLWELCDGQASLDQIVGAFASAYGMPSAELHDDVVYILTKFRQLGVLV